MDSSTGFAPSTNPCPIRSPEDFAALSTRGLSPHFEPFLEYFVREALRTGGQAWSLGLEPGPRGLLILDSAERVGTIFGASAEATEGLSRLAKGISLFSESLLNRPYEGFHVYSVDLRGGTPPHRFRHHVREYADRDAEAVLRLLREVQGPVDERWLTAGLPPQERGFVVEVMGEIVGTAWVSVVLPHSRLHSLAVRAPYRRLGIASDLWHARVLQAHAAGATSALSEISERNLPSVRVAVRGGMRPVGRMYRYEAG